MVWSQVPPRLPLRGLPRHERDHADHVQLLLSALETWCVAFEAAVQLFNFSRKRGISALQTKTAKRYQQWMLIAARDAASSVFKFYEDMGWIKHNLNGCPTISAGVDHQLKRAATKRFKTNFPGCAGARHTSHHHGNVYGSPKNLAEHISGSIVIKGGIANDTYVATFEKRTIELPISQASLTALQEIRDLYWSAFEGIDPDYRRGIELRQHIDRQVMKAKRAIKGNEGVRKLRS